MAGEQASPPLPPLPVSAKILRIFGRGNCKEAIFALKNGIFRRKNRPVPAVHAAGDDCTAKGLRSSIHNGRLAAPNGLQRSLVHWTSASPVSRTARGEAPSHRARASCCSSVSFAASIPQFAMVVSMRSQVRLRLSLAHWAYYGLFPPLAAAFVRPLCEKGAFWEVAQPYEVALPKSLLFPEGKREVSRR